jgi:hypothetical protein
VVFVAILVLALGETAGAVMSQFRPQTERWARARVAANASAHGLTGAVEYDTEVTERAAFTAEAGLSFLHTHAQGLPAIVLLAATIVATLVPWRRLRGALYALLGAGTLFPLGYLVYGVAVLELGRDAGIELSQRWVLTPLGGAVIVAVVALAVALARAPRPSAP